MDADRAHQHNAMRVMKTIQVPMKPEAIQAHALSALVYAVLDVAQAIRELKHDSS